MAHRDLHRPSALILLRRATVDAPRMGSRDTSRNCPRRRGSPDCSRMRVDSLRCHSDPARRREGYVAPMESRTSSASTRIDGPRPTITRPGDAMLGPSPAMGRADRALRFSCRPDPRDGLRRGFPPPETPSCECWRRPYSSLARPRGHRNHRPSHFVWSARPR